MKIPSATRAKGITFTSFIIACLTTEARALKLLPVLELPESESRPEQSLIPHDTQSAFTPRFTA